MSTTDAAKPKSVDKLALAGAGIAVVMAVMYVVLVNSQGETAAGWVVVMLLLGAACAAFGARGGRGSLTALWMATSLLGILGLVAILSIGLPILVAAALCAVSAIRALPSLLPRR